jgi:hypothetical protein
MTTIRLDWIGFGWCACQAMNSQASGRMAPAIFCGVLAVICLAYAIRNDRKDAALR